MHLTDSGTYIHNGREISKEQLHEIQETVLFFPRLSLRELSGTICEYLGWYTASGNYKLSSCLSLLEELEAAGLLKLPAKRRRRKKQSSPPCFRSLTAPQPEITGSLSDLGNVWIERVHVDKKEDVRLWNEYVARYHYLGYKKPFGYPVRYFVMCEQGKLGCILFSGAAKALSRRDRWIGWRSSHRVHNLPWVINNSRFLLFPWITVKNLASHVLAQVIHRVSDDWFGLWGYRPVLAETFVDPIHFRGSCYKAAGWEYLGMTTGEGLVRKGKNYRTTPKMIFAKPLVHNFRAVLCRDDLQGRVWE